MATKTLFITLSRASLDQPWGFSLEQMRHKRLGQALVVQTVQSASVAYEAGLLPADIVLGIDNSPITGRPLTHALACELIERAGNSIELQVLRDPKNRVKKTIMYATKSPEPYRPVSVNRGVIPSLAQMDSGVRLPDNNVKEFHTEKAREQWAITKQTYRTTPLIEPRPKVRRDWPMGSYLKYMEGPGWHDPPKQIMVHEGKMKLLSQVNQADGPLMHRQYNSPINLYSEDNLNTSLNASGSVSPGRHTSTSASPQPPHFNAKSNLQKPLTVDITHSPTYQFLQEERAAQRPGHSPKYSPVTGQHSPGAPVQTPYFKTLMHHLNVSDH